MKISKDLVCKVERYSELEEECHSLYEEIGSTLTRLDEQNADVCIDDFYITDSPSGEPQGEGEYCDQWSGYIEDDYQGVYYYPLEGSGKYLAVKYTC